MLFFRKTTLLALLALIATGASAQPITNEASTAIIADTGVTNSGNWQDLRAYPRYDQVDILWMTTSESNIDRFEIERSSNNVNFEEIGTVYGSGNSENALQYAFTDPHPFNGENYYRIKQVSFNGDFVYSYNMSASIYREKKSDLRLIPNPTGPGSVVQIEGSGLASNAHVLIEMRTNTGEVVIYDHGMTDHAGNISTRMSVTLEQGLYIVTVAGEGTGISSQLIVR